MHARIPTAAAAALTLLVLAIAAPAGAATLTVANCNDQGTGSLRDAAALAQDGDVIDLRGLTCSRVLLKSGPILFTQRDVTLQGPGRARLAIDGGGRSSVLRHPRGGLFRIRDLTVRWGRIDDPVWALGGCVYSGGNVSLQRVNVHHCVVRSPRRAEGGGIAAALDVRLIESHVYTNRAVATSPDALAQGGGTYSPRSLLLDRSRLCDNEAPYAGGGWVNMTATVRESTVSGNTGGAWWWDQEDMGTSIQSSSDPPFRTIPISACFCPAVACTTRRSRRILALASRPADMAFCRRTPSPST